MNKDKNLNIRISTKDLNYIKQRSKKANLTITGYVTKRALNKKIYVYDGYKEFLAELRKIGININQIARACNSGYKPNPSVALFQKELKSIWQSLKSKPPKEI
ncbi:MAG: MobC family plasmid mobilization relaxosome protein [Clostridia bacterium]|nr:MobC family plasmid mobilization relaxosome protein [Clostridia bacterium]